jgi:hypothetical protein
MRPAGLPGSQGAAPAIRHLLLHVCFRIYAVIWITLRCDDWHTWKPSGQEGYAALTCSRRDIDDLIEYIKRQEEHHRKTTFEEEYRKLLSRLG